MLAFVMVWAYLAFSQLLIIWAGNLPEEIPLVPAPHQRRLGRSSPAALALFYFAVPFVVLLGRNNKRQHQRLAALAVGILIVRAVDMFFLVAPEFSPARLTVHWLDLGDAGRPRRHLDDGVRVAPRHAAAAGAERPAAAGNAREEALKEPAIMRDSHEPGETPPDAAKGHETRDLSTRVVVIFAASLVVGAVIIYVVVWVIYAQFAKEAASAYPREYPMARVGRAGASARAAAADQAARGAAADARRRRIAGSTPTAGWTRSAGIVRIPIEQAMAHGRRAGAAGARRRGRPYAPASEPDESNSGRTPPSAGR